MYEVADYGRMMADSVRMKAYVEALRTSVRPGDVVVDLGAGTGIMTLWALRFGARHVYAIETAPALSVARQICRDNGFADRVTFFHARSNDVELPERADVVVSDLRGRHPVWPSAFDALDDARARLLRDGGILLPKRDVLRVGVVEAPVLRDWYLQPWAEGPFDSRAAVDVIVNSLLVELQHLERPVLLSDAATWATIEYRKPMPKLLEGTVELTVERDATAHGLSLWFDGEIADGITFSNAPGTDLVYSRMFALFPEPLAVRAGDRIGVTMLARRAEDAFVWGWTTTHRRGAEALATFRQTTFFAAAEPPVAYDRSRVVLSPTGCVAFEAMSAIAASAEPIEVRAVSEAVRARSGSSGSVPAIAAVVRQVARLFCAPR